MQDEPATPCNTHTKEPSLFQEDKNIWHILSNYLACCPSNVKCSAISYKPHPINKPWKSIFW